MAYRQCSDCGVITDEDEPKCPSCLNNHLGDKIITAEDLVSKIKKRKTSPSKIWTKNPNAILDAIYPAPESLPH